MKILESMSFSPSWFFTIPGILITVGVVILIISLILLLSKDKSKDNIETESIEKTQNNDYEFKPIVAPTVSAPVMEPTTPVAQAEIVPVTESVVETPVVPTPVVEQPKVEIFEPTSQQTEVSPTIEPVIPVTPIVAPTVSAPVMEPTTPVTQAETVPVTESVVPAPIVTETPSVSIYGGVDPTITLNTTEPVEPKPVIYGGASPLENTAPIPVVGNNTPYSGNVVEPEQQKSQIETLDI